MPLRKTGGFMLLNNCHASLLKLETCVDADRDCDGASLNSARPISVLYVASEIFPLIKTGGLADVAGSFPKALSALDIEVRIFIPGYPAVIRQCSDMHRLSEINLLGQRAEICAASLGELKLLIFKCDALFDRAGGPYCDDTGNEYHDNWRRFSAFSQAAAIIAKDGIGNWCPSVVHLNDWQTALTPSYMKALDCNTPTVLTIHNLAFQGQYGCEVFEGLGLPAKYLSLDCLLHYGDVSFLKAGITQASCVTTVSPTYAREICLDQHGMGMAGVLRSRESSFQGIVNGVDDAIWDPECDNLLPVNYSADTLEMRSKNRNFLERQFGFQEDAGPIIGVVSRITWQKGLDLLECVARHIVNQGGRLVVMGEGDLSITNTLLKTVRDHSGRVAVQIGYSEATAHLMHAGCDIILQPSRFEPCGLTQLYALKYGAIPIVGRTGGLAETVVEANEAALSTHSATGFKFTPGSISDLKNAISHAFKIYNDKKSWRIMQRQAMKTDFSWKRSAEQYKTLYKNLTDGDEKQRSFTL